MPTGRSGLPERACDGVGRGRAAGPVALALLLVMAGCDGSRRLERARSSGPVLGQPLPAFEMRDLGDQPFSLGELRGRVVLVNVWATWCVPCQAEMPELQSLQAAYDPDELTVLGVSVDLGDGVPILRFLEANGITYPNVRADMVEIVETLDVNEGIPHTILVDRAGVVRAYWRGRFRPEDPSAAALLRQIVDERPGT